MNMFKKNEGFTLVELIVVIAILAILAGVAVPAYSGYITKANKVNDTTALAAVKTAVMAAYATEGTVNKINFIEGNASAPASLKVIIDDEEEKPVDTSEDSDFVAFYGGELKLELETGSSAVWNNTANADNKGEWVIAE